MSNGIWSPEWEIAKPPPQARTSWKLFQIPDSLEVIRADTYEDCERIHRRYPWALFCECSFGERSYLPGENGVANTGWGLDHHNKFHTRPSVFIQAYHRELFGVMWGLKKPVVVYTGYPDEDWSFAAVSMLGLIPHYSFEQRFPRSDYPKVPAESYELFGTNLSHVAELVGEVDIDPNKVRTLLDTSYGRRILRWRQEAGPWEPTRPVVYAGLIRAVQVLTDTRELINDAAAESRIEDLQRVAEIENRQIVNDTVAVVDFSTYGAPNSDFYQVWLEQYPVLVAFIGWQRGVGSISIAVRDVESGEKLFGKGVLGKVYRKLRPLAGNAGGHALLGGCDRNREFVFENAVRIGELLYSFTKNGK